MTKPFVKFSKSSATEPHQRTSEPGSMSNRVTRKEQASISSKTPLSWCWSMRKSDLKLIREVVLVVELGQAWQERKRWKRNPTKSKGGAPAMIRVHGSGSGRGLG